MGIKKIIFLLLTVLLSAGSFAQVRFSCILKDDNSGEFLPNVSIIVKGGLVNTITDNRGEAAIFVKPGKYFFSFSSAGHQPHGVELNINASFQDSVITIKMKKEEKKPDDVIIYSTRTNSRIENSVTRVEVLGKEEVEMESGVKPSQIANRLGDVVGIQSQQTSAVTGNTDLRIQGLPGNYTQILRDGMPLFGGFAGGFSILQIPPPDLYQVEIIKGANSTLYGGGAIAGLVNIISKKPIAGKPKRSLMMNQSSLQETSFNFYLSERKEKLGYTFFAGGNYQKQKDINNDGFSDLARQEAAFIHPSFFFYPDEKNTINFSINSTYEDRIGGDMDILSGYYSNYHQFFIQNQTFRNTLDLTWENRISQNEKISLKATSSNFNRDIGTPVFGMKARQFSFYTEASYTRKLAKHEVVAGINVNGEKLRKGIPDSTLIMNHRYSTVGLFAQDDWRLLPKLTIEPGFRIDFHNQFGTFILPRLSMLYKLNQYISIRAGGGMGYKIPSVFDTNVDEREYRRLAPLLNAKAEKSTGFNWDFNFKKKIGDVEISLNQSFFYTRVEEPLVMQKSTSVITYVNALKPITTKGLESWVQVGISGLEAYFSYTITDAQKKYDPDYPYLELSVRNKFASVISYNFSKRFRAGFEAFYTGKQYLEDGRQTPAFPVYNGMIRYDIGRFSFVLNCENINDYRQTKIEPIVIPPYANPSFKQLWAPIGGRVANLSMKISL